MKRMPWWAWILIADIFMVVITIVHKYPLRFPGKWVLSYPFNLANEMNLATWWSGIVLLAVGLVCYELFCRGGLPSSRRAWLLLAAVFAGLSLDEIGSIHERLGGFSKILPIAAVLAMLLVLTLLTLSRNAETRTPSLFIGTGFFLFGLVVFQEFLEHAVTYPEWSRGLRVGVEEGTELAGALVALYGAVFATGRRSGGLDAALARIPTAMLTLPVATGFVLHAAGALILPGAIDLAAGGNPLVWYPSAMAFLLLCVCCSASEESGEGTRRLRALSASLLIGYSAVTVFRPTGYLIQFAPAVTVADVNAAYLAIGIVLIVVFSLIFRFFASIFFITILSLNVLLFVAYVAGTDPSLLHLQTGFLSLCLYWIVTRKRQCPVQEHGEGLLLRKLKGRELL